MIHIVMGLSGSGKTSATKYLQQKLNAVVINTDILRTKLFPHGEYTETGDFTPEQLKQVYEALRPIAFYLVKTSPEKHFIFEGSFRYEGQRASLIEEIELLKHPYSILWLRVKTEIAKQRMEYRHQFEGAPDMFEEYLEQLKVFEEPKNAYVIDNSGALNDLHSNIDTYLEATQ